MPLTSSIPPAPELQVLPRDLTPYRAGNTGIPYVHRFESGRPGPHVLVNALTHGNEFCGMVAATHLLDSGVRPKVGTLTVSFANVEAYESFDAADPFKSRQLVHNMNRVWTPQWLNGAEDSPELRRARELRPVVEAADHLLDIHSTAQEVDPFWVYLGHARNAQAAAAIGAPPLHMVMPKGMGTGTPLVEYGRHGEAGFHGIGLLVECGQHFAHASGELATQVALRFLAHFGLVDADPAWPAPVPPRRYELIRAVLVKSEDAQFVRPLVGMETFDEGELIATNGDEEVRSPCDGCTIFMPTRKAVVGRELIYLTRPVG
jgi:predicted deacylase